MTTCAFAAARLGSSATITASMLSPPLAAQTARRNGEPLLVGTLKTTHANEVP